MRSAKKLVLLSLIVMNFVEQPTPPVIIEQGILTGIVSADGTIFEYLGIPYGTFNSSNRFQAPYPPPKWDGVFKATEQSICPQYQPIIGTYGSEDCLHVNVYVPVKAEKPLPVMVYIHGGAFIVGDGGKLLYRPEFLVKKDVILVTMNYRLGILGFLCLGIREAPGNTGLKDQIAALRWVKENIAAFGGDPDNITLFGESAGATSTALLYASPATEGLFHRAIVQSGSSLANWAMSVNPLHTASRTVKRLGYNTENPHELYNILSALTISELYSVKPTVLMDSFFDHQSVFLPCVENNIPGVEPVFTDIPYNLLHNRTKNIPIIYGTNSKEGLLVVYEAKEKLDERNNELVFGPDLVFPSDEEATRVDKIVKEFYFKNRAMSFKEKVDATNLFGQLRYEMPVIFETEIVLKKNSAPVYNYIFNYNGGRNILNYMYGIYDDEGACHGDDLLYLFNGYIWPFPINKRDRGMIDLMTNLWTNFAKHGNPTPTSIESSIKWQSSTNEELKFLYIDDKVRMGPMPNPESYKMWKNVYDKYRRKDPRNYQPLYQ